MDRVMVLAVFLLCATVAIVGIRNLLLAWSMRRWPSAQGEVRSSSVLKVRPRGSRTGFMYRPEILYAFSVGGTEYTGVRRTLFPIQVGGTDYAAKVVALYPVGQRVSVYYDPSNPRQSILIRGSALLMAGAITVFSLYMCAMIVHWFLHHGGTGSGH